MRPLRIRLFYHSVISDWNNGHAHFLRGLITELVERGHDVRLFEAVDNWSVENLRRERGEAAIAEFHRLFPRITVGRYHDLDAASAIGDADLVIVHEWNAPELVAALGELRRSRGGFRLLFHDTHHRAVTDPGAMRRFDLGGYDGVLAFGDVLRDLYLREGWAERAWTWHEAADTRVFRPRPEIARERDLVWVGNWGDGERTEELHEFLIEPARALGLRARVHGARYPAEGRRALAAAGIEYAGSLPNHEVPGAFARARVTVHVPRRPYAQSLPGIPTIRPFEAMACGIPLVSGPWDDAERLFAPGQDYLVARDGGEMRAHLRFLLEHPEAATAQAARARQTIERRHSCAHRIDELLTIADELGVGREACVPA